VGKEVFVAFSPERVDPGRTDWTTINTPKVIRWYYPRLHRCRCRLVLPGAGAGYSGFLHEVAEMAKLLENTFRMINLGLVNELAIMCNVLGVDVWEVIEAAATKPFGFMKFTPGPGIGGHCIPIDPLYLSWKLRSLELQRSFYRTGIGNQHRYAALCDWQDPGCAK
jgi:UDP-N-acetyl-D-glucosamine dehydrogenase